MKLKNIILLLIIVSNSTFAQKERYKKTEKNTLEGTKFGILDLKENKQVIPNIYSQIGDYTKGKFVAVLNNKAGLIDSLNTTIIPFQYTTISDFFDDRIFLTQNQKCAMANEKGTILTKFEFDEIDEAIFTEWFNDDIETGREMLNEYLGIENYTEISI